ncbi:15638_t:CDS:1 [Acaulospora morrowiae]|uniref:60S ribosomal protein L27 n=1 Tax=Acaulospora morrowiae TaxID=94023 RepID=A0A9N9FHU3_9GLOM|nr:15638_t:CDS:1 [Acaulospora morrowiae]
MVKFLKPGKVAIILSGRFAGKKVVIVKNYDEGTKERQYGHAIVVGIERYPAKVTKRMGPKRIAKRSRVKPFIKIINYNHLMPTRYVFELDDIKQLVTPEVFKEPTQRETAKKALRKSLKEKYTSGKNRWFFDKLRF